MTEDTKTSVLYAFTVTLKPKPYFLLMAEDQYDDTAMPLAEHLRAIGLKFTLVSELTKNFNIHYHGIITLPLGKDVNVRKKFVDSFRRSKLFGFVKIDQITNEEGWIDYIGKSLDEVYNAIHRRPIIKDDFEIFEISKTDKYGCTW